MLPLVSEGSMRRWLPWIVALFEEETLEEGIEDMHFAATLGG